MVGGAARKKDVRKGSKKEYERKEVKNKKLVLNLFQDHNPMKKISDYKEVKQGGNNETKKGFYPY